MADNLSKTEWDAGTEVVSTDVAGVHTPHVKIAFGGTGVSTPVEHTATGGLPIEIRNAHAVEDLTTTPLANGASYTTAVFNSYEDGLGLTFIFVADQTALLELLESHDNVTYYVASDANYPGGSYVFNEMHVAHAKYFKIKVTNNSGSAMTSMVMQTIQRFNGIPWKIKLDEAGNVVRGGLGNNVASPGTVDGLESLTAVAMAAAPSYTEGRLVLPRVTLAGDTPITLDGETVTVTATDLDVRNLSSAQDTVGVLQATASNLNAQVVGEIAHDAIDSGNPISIGGIARTSLTSVAALDRVKGIFDLQGRQIIRSNVPRGLRIKNTITLTTTTETTLLAAAASTFHDLTKLWVANTSGTAVRVDFRDTTAGTVLFSLYAPAGQTVGFTDSNDPIEQATVNTNWTAQLSAGVTDVRIFAQAVKNIA